MNYLCSAFAFYKFRRYDVRGKKYLSSGEKYYLCDHAFKYAKLGIKNLDLGRTLENIIAMELRRRGYEVYVGVLYKRKSISSRFGEMKRYTFRLPTISAGLKRSNARLLHCSEFGMPTRA